MADPRRVEELLRGLGADKPQIKYACARALRQISAERPELLYPHFEFFVRQLDHENKIMQWEGAFVLSHLVGVDVKNRFEAIFDKYFSPIPGPVMITAAHAIQGGARIALAKPAWADRIAARILGVARARYRTAECRNVAAGHAILALGAFFDHVENAAPVTRFVRKQLRNPRPATRKKAERFLKRVFCLGLASVCLFHDPPAVAGAPPGEFLPGEIWCDTEENPIDAHGGGVLLFQDVYYWYGEDRGHRAYGAVSCYASTNLLEWRHAGTVLSQTNLPQINGRRTFVERPKVIFNPSTKKFVMWMHLEQPGYRFSHAGIALGDTPSGEFTFLKAIRPITNTNDFASLSLDPARQKELGGTFRDLNLFVDSDGHAYVFYSSEDNWTMYVARLNSDFTGPELPAFENKTWAKILVRKMREGAAPFKFQGKYYLITSACTGWRPNAADIAVADQVLGPYRSLGNPCRGPDAERTFGAQSTFVLPAPGHAQAFVFLADRWNASYLPDSRYVWLPLQFDAAGNPIVQWRGHWTLSALD